MINLNTKYNQPETLLMLTSFPAKKGEPAADNAIGRYSLHLLQHLPKSQRVVVICEKRSKNDIPYQIGKNLLVVPSYRVNSLLLVVQINRVLGEFWRAKNLVVQFEFSIYGARRSVPLVMLVLVIQKLLGRKISVMLHQVVVDIGSLSGHLNLIRGALNTRLYNLLLKYFYRYLAVLTKVLVHDSFLKRQFLISTGKQVVIINHGIKAQKTSRQNYRSKSRLGWGIKEDDLITAVFGYRSWYKGTDWIVNCIRRENKKNPRVKLLLAGGVSPTLVKTQAYQRFNKRMERLIEKSRGSVISTEYVPESKVKEVFTAAEVIIFPYRTKMSASGALSLTWQYHKPFLVSREFAHNLEEEDVLHVFGKFGIDPQRLVFDLDSPPSFSDRLYSLVNDPVLMEKLKEAAKEISVLRSWEKAGRRYLQECLPNFRQVPGNILKPFPSLAKREVNQ